MTSKKRRRYGDLAERPLPTEDPALVDEVFAAFTRRPSNLSPDNLGEAKEPSLDKIAAPKIEIPKTPSPDIKEHLAQTVGSLPELPGPTNLTPLSVSPLIAQAEALTYRKGYSRHNHDFWDVIISQLPGNEQNVYSWLWRFREGNSNVTVIVSLPTLAARCGVDEKTVGRAMKRLADKGFVREHSSHFGKGKAQGKRYWVYVPTALLNENLSPDKMGSPTNLTPIKEKALKENLKREMASPDYKACPDCSGSGFWYPEGMDKGVAKCKHVKLVSRAE